MTQEEFIYLVETRKLTTNEKCSVLFRIWYGLTFKQIGQELGFSTARARQVYLKSLRKLRHPETKFFLNNEFR